VIAIKEVLGEDFITPGLWTPTSPDMNTYDCVLGGHCRKEIMLQILFFIFYAIEEF
jgi:hypothetical protein